MEATVGEYRSDALITRVFGVRQGRGLSLVSSRGTYRHDELDPKSRGRTGRENYKDQRREKEP